MNAQNLTLAAIGYNSEVAEVFVRGFLAEGVKLRLLTRNPEDLARRYPDATIISGSMMNPDDVARVMDGVDAAIVQTPGAQRNDPESESRAAIPIAAGAKAAKLRHLIYTSSIAAGSKTGVGRFDGKAQAESHFVASGVPYSFIRCSTYMEDLFDERLDQFRAGKFVFPITKARRFNYTCQKDFAPFVVRELLKKDQILNRPIDFVDPKVYSLKNVEQLLTEAAGRPVKAVSKFPTYYLMMAARPYFLLKGHPFAWILPLMRHWDRYGNVASGEPVRSIAPAFPLTSLKSHLAALFHS